MSTHEEHFDSHLKDRIDYPGYLQLEKVLDAQEPLSSSHDEMLFIVIHQATELWLKLTIHELNAARELIIDDQLRPTFKMLSRVSRIQAQLIQSWDALATLTPSDYLTFRDLFGPASGFQSHQYRMLEFILGNRSRAKLKVFAHRPAIHSDLSAEINRPSLYREVILMLSRQGFAIDASAADASVDRNHQRNDSILEAWRTIYADTERYWNFYELAEKLVDLEDWFRQWRFRHLTTVERVIGFKRGTGGTAGVAYLERALDIELFPELWHLRTTL